MNMDQNTPAFNKKPNSPTRRSLALGLAALPAAALPAAAAPSEIEALFCQIEKISAEVEVAIDPSDDWLYQRADEAAGHVDRMLSIRPRTLREFAMQAVTAIDEDPCCPNSTAFLGQVRRILGRA